MGAARGTHTARFVIHPQERIMHMSSEPGGSKGLALSSLIVVGVLLLLFLVPLIIAF